MAKADIDVSDFLAADFERRIHLALRGAGRKLWSSDLAVAWGSLIERVEGCIAADVQEELLRQQIQLAPYADSMETAYQKLVGDGIRVDVRRPRLVAAMISCKRYLPKARTLAAELRPHFDALHVVIGEPKERRARVEGELLIVPAHDDYESLPSKVFETLVAVRRIHGPVATLKMDDDGSFVSPPDWSALDELVQRVEYAGRPSGAPHSDRCWHFGKCSRIKELPYGKPFVRQWALGPLYLLGARALDELVRTYVRFPGTLAGELFEDKLVGDVLGSLSIDLVPTDLSAMVGVQPYIEPDPEGPTTVTWSGLGLR